MVIGAATTSVIDVLLNVKKVSVVPTTLAKGAQHDATIMILETVFICLISVSKI